MQQNTLKILLVIGCALSAAIAILMIPQLIRGDITHLGVIVGLIIASIGLGIAANKSVTS